MTYRYPLDVQELLKHARARGPHYLETTGLDRLLPEDVVLGRLARKGGTGWFPYTTKPEWHPALDVGMGDWEKDSIVGLPVVAAADGVVAYVDPRVSDERGRCLGRVIVEHRAPDGTPFYLQYAHLVEIGRWVGEPIKEGDPLGKIGPYESFPHLELGAASLFSLGGEDLAPEFAYTAATPLYPPWDALRVRVARIEPREWPVEKLSGRSGYFYDPVELIRWCRGDPRQHDAGPASTHGGSLFSAGVLHALGPGAKSDVKVSVVVRSPSLRIPEVEELVLKRSIDPPIGPGDKRTELVKAIQGALREAGFARFAPTGTYGPMTVNAVKTFQKDKLKKLLEGEPPPIPGKKASDAPEDGKVDWLTLVGLDAYADIVAKAPKPAPKNAKAKKEPPKPIDPATAENTFDATGSVSIRMGVRMVRAMLPWIWHGDWDEKNEKIVPQKDPTTGADLPLGVGYSTTVFLHYGSDEEIKKGLSVLRKELREEWPDVRLDSALVKTITVDGHPDPIPVYFCWNLNWKGTGFTNCCNSLLAALAVALGGKSFGVKGGNEFGTPRGDSVVTYDMTRADTPVVQVKASPGAKVCERPAIQIFEGIFVTNACYSNYRSPDGERLADGTRYGGHVSAIDAFGIGKALQSWSTRSEDPQGFLRLRIGDIMASWTLKSGGGHAFIAADVRYGIWVKKAPPPNDAQGKKGKKAEPVEDKGPHYFLDQSSLLASEEGMLVKLSGAEAKGSPRRFTKGEPPLTEGQCDDLMTAEGEAKLEARIAAFLARTEFGGEPVDRIEVLCWRQLSANATTLAAHARPHLGRSKTPAEKEEDQKKWSGKYEDWEQKWKEKKELEQKALEKVKDEKERKKSEEALKSQEEDERKKLLEELETQQARKVFSAATDADLKAGGYGFTSVRQYVQAAGITLPWQDDAGRRISFGRFFAPLK